MKKISLEELGNKLPIGIEKEGPHREFTLKPYRMKEERLIGQVYEKNRNVSMGKFVSKVLSVMLKSIGSIDFDEMNEGQRRLTFSQMYVGDVIYLYIRLRLEALGNELKVNLTCNNCLNKFDFVADLNTLEIKIVDNPEELKTKIKLKKGWELNGKTYHEVYLKPSLWSFMESLGNGLLSNPGKMKAQMFKTCITGVEGKDNFMVTDEMIDQLYKVDIELLVNKIDEIHPGPIMVIEDACPNCEAQFKAPIDWSHENFFGASSM